MKAKLLFTLLTCSILAVTAWMVQAPNPVQADDEVPEKYRDTVRKGLNFLERMQHKDGHWESDGGKYPVATTALAGMALLMQGREVSIDTNRHISKAVDWLTDRNQARQSGVILADDPAEIDCYMYGHGLATMFLSWAYAHGTEKVGRRQKLHAVITRGVQFIVKAQSSQGGWYRTSRAEGHDLDEVFATVIELQALHMAGHPGISVKDSQFVVKDGQTYLKTALPKLDKAMKPGTCDTLAVALAYLTSQDAANLGENPDYSKWFTYWCKEIPIGRDIRFGRDELVHYYYAQAIFNNRFINPRQKDARWADYRMAMFDQLKAVQNKDGSWPSKTEGPVSLAVGAGPVYTAALWCTILQFDKMSHPLTRRN